MSRIPIALPSSLHEAYGDVLCAAGERFDLPILPKDLTRDHFHDLRGACLVDIAHLEGTLGINGWKGRTVDEIDSEDPGAVLYLRAVCMESRRLLRWTEYQLKWTEYQLKQEVG